MSLQARFDRLDSLSDIQDAISMQRRAVELTPDGQSDKPVWFNNLGNSWQGRFDRLSELSDVEAAILIYISRGRLTPDGYRQRGSTTLGTLCKYALLDLASSATSRRLSWPSASWLD